jgi:hypothetical protein
LRAALRPNAVAYGEDGIEAVVFDVPRDVARALAANYPEFPDSCPVLQLTFRVNVLQMLVDGPNVLLKQVRNQRLAQPQSFVGKAALDACPAVIGLVESDFTSRGYGAIRHPKAL